MASTNKVVLIGNIGADPESQDELLQAAQEVLRVFDFLLYGPKGEAYQVILNLSKAVNKRKS
jgi:hypothetical protein